MSRSAANDLRQAKIYYQKAIDLDPEYPWCIMPIWQVYYVIEWVNMMSHYFIHNEHLN